MPTLLDRIQVPITPEVSKALATARALWPELPASRQIARLATVGASSLSTGDARRRAIAELRGKYADAYPPGYLDDLRQGWEW